ncbi:uncharacterized protein FPRN_03177 [Fusarium proliferatum]|nr:uncharacterized protein FPRN_03177 [Fusarium proliferatum]
MASCLCLFSLYLLSKHHARPPDLIVIHCHSVVGIIPYLLTDFMESDEGVIEPREESSITTQPVDDVGNSTQDPGDGSNDHVDATANSNDWESEDQDGEISVKKASSYTSIPPWHDYRQTRRTARGPCTRYYLRYGNTSSNTRSMLWEPLCGRLLVPSRA